MPTDRHASPHPCRARREARGLTQAALAAQVGLSRQSLHAIEAGRAKPAVDVALRLARALDATVEELFGGGAHTEAVRAQLVGPAALPAETRVSLAHVAGRWVATPLSCEAAAACADGVTLTPAAPMRTSDVELTRPLQALRDNVLVMGCATGLGALTARLNATGGPGRFVFACASSGAALGALASGAVHVAGVHLTDERSGEQNLPDVRKAARRAPLAVYTLARWEVGLCTRPSHARRVRTAADLAQRGVRLVRRDAGAGAQRTLERALRDAGLTLDDVRAIPAVARSHAEVAYAVSMDAADAGVVTRDVARAFGLHFVPWAQERYDLALERELLEDPRIVRMLEVLVGPQMRRELAALGYEVDATGAHVADVRAA